MRARRTHVANRDDYDSFDLPPPEVFDAPPEPPVDEAPAEPSMGSTPSLTAPVRVCLVCGDDPSVESGCGHFEVATVTALGRSMLHSLAALRAQHESLRDELRALRRLMAPTVASGDATIEVREPPVVAPRVVLIPPAAKRPRRAAPVVTEQGRFGFVEPVTAVAEEAARDQGAAAGEGQPEAT